MKEWFGCWYNKYATAAFVGAVVVGGYNGICWRGLTASDWGTWVGSIGTVGALIGTIWLAARGTRIDHQQQMSLAMLTLAGLRFRIEAAHNQFRFIALALEKNAFDEERNGAHKAIYEATCKLELWTPADLRDLSILPNRLALRLAHCVGEIRGVIQILSDVRLLALHVGKAELFDILDSAVKEVIETCGEAVELSRRSKYRPESVFV